MRMLLILVAAALMVLASPAAAQYEPVGSLTVSPPNPEPGDDITVTITGCTPAPRLADVVIDGVIVGQAPLDADGNFTGTFQVPLEARGEVMVTVECDAEVLSSMIDVRIGDLPFQDDDGGGPALPRTGSNSMPLAQLGAVLLGLGCLALLLARRSDDEDEPELVGAHHG